MIIEGLEYFVDPNNQFVLRNGSPNVYGIVRVYYAGTDDIAKTYCDFEGTRNPADIRLDNNGRAIIIADATKTYRVEVRDSNGGLLWTVEPAYCIGGEGGGEDIYEIVMFDLSQAGHGLYDDIDANLRAGLLPIIYTGSQGRVRYYYYTARDSQAHTMTFTCGYDGRVELLVLKDDDTYEFDTLRAALPIRIVDGVITNNGTDLNVRGDNSWSEGIGKDEYQVAEVVGNVFLDSVIELDYVGLLRAGDIVLIGDSLQAISSVNYGSNTIVVAPGVRVFGGEKVTISGGSIGIASHTEGCATKASGKYAHAEGYRSKASGFCSHSEGQDTRAYSDGAHAEGRAVVAHGTYSHAEGYGCMDYIDVAQDCTESYQVEVSYIGSDVVVGARANVGNDIYEIVAIDEDTPSITLSSPVTLHTGDRIYIMTGAFGAYSHAEGDATVSAGTGSHSEGCNTTALEVGAHAEGRETVASNYSAHAEGDSCVASGINAHAEGYESIASSYCAHAEGTSESSGYYSHAEGRSVASYQCAHAEGDGCIADGKSAHAEGEHTISLSYGSHSEGGYTIADGYGAHAEGKGSDVDTYDVVDDPYSGTERYTVVLDYTYDIEVGDYVCFGYSYTPEENVWHKVTYVDVDTNTIEISGYTTAENGDSVYRKNGFASGDGAHAEGLGCNAVGYGAHAGGYESVARGNYTFAQGYVSKVSADYGVAIGKYCNTSGSGGVAIGNTVATYGDNSISFGYNSSAQAEGSSSIGSSTRTYGQYSLAAGNSSETYAYASTALGEGAKTYAGSSLAINKGRTFGYSSVCIGPSGDYTSATYATTDTYYDNVIYVDDTSGISAGNIIVVFGADHHTESYKVSFVGADHIVIDGYADVAEYDDIYVYNTGSIGAYSLHIGRSNSAIGDFSVCIGEGLKQSKDYGTAIGKYNVDDNAIFVVGNGTDENTHADCFKIDANGKLMFMHNGNLTDLSTLLNSHNIT